MFRARRAIIIFVPHLQELQPPIPIYSSKCGHPTYSRIINQILLNERYHLVLLPFDLVNGFQIESYLPQRHLFPFLSPHPEISSPLFSRIAHFRAPLDLPPLYSSERKYVEGKAVASNSEVVVSAPSARIWWTFLCPLSDFPFPLSALTVWSPLLGDTC